MKKIDKTLQPGYPIMTYNEYSELALGCSISEDALPRATEFLYEIGILIHFNDPNRGEFFVILSNKKNVLVFYQLNRVCNLLHSENCH